MLYIVVGIAAGAALLMGWIPGLAAPVDHLLTALVNGTESAAASLIGRHLGSPHLHGVALVATVLVPVVVPGLVAAAMVVAARASLELRHLIAGIAVIGALASFLVLPASSALVLLVAAVVFAVAASTLTGLVLAVPLTACATVLAVRHVDLLVRGRYPAVSFGAHRLAWSFGGDYHLWTVLLILAGLAPVAAAAKGLTGRSHGALRRAPVPA